MEGVSDSARREQTLKRLNEINERAKYLDRSFQCHAESLSVELIGGFTVVWPHPDKGPNAREKEENNRNKRRHRALN